jgi:type IV pilus assembly protein PilA
MLSKIRRFNLKGFTLVELMVVVAILGILAIIAVPAFIKYMKRAKTTEAVDELDKIHKGAAYYYTQPHANTAGSRIACQFPVTGALSPASDCCTGTDADGDTRCDVNQSNWNSATWAALSFQMGDQHYFQYNWTANGLTLAAATGTASAHADLDCDSAYSTFQRVMYGDPGATKTGNECASVSSSAMYIMNETE